MQHSTAWRTIRVVLWFCCALFSQSKPVTSATQQAQPSSRLAKKPSKPKLTPERRRGLRLLKSSEAEAPGLEPAMQTYVLWQVSYGYGQLKPAKADALLRRALTASREIQDRTEPKRCHSDQVNYVREWLEREILQQMLQSDLGKANPETVEKLLPQADDRVRTELLEQLADEYLRKQNFDRTHQILGVP